MATGKQKLTQDLKRIEMMVDELVAYLDDDALFGASLSAGLTTVTLGNYLMGQNRLLALRSTALEAVVQTRLDAVVARFDRVLYYNTEEFKLKVGQELETRLQGWRGYVRQLTRKEIRANCYEVEAENRVIVEDILQKLCLLGGQPDSHICEEIDRLDRELRQHWQPGKFIWPAEWKPAYPQSIYWWLYGRPQNIGKARVKGGEGNTYIPQPRQRLLVDPFLVAETGGV